MHKTCEKADSDKLALKRTLRHCKQPVTEQLLKRATLLFHIHTGVFTLGRTDKLPPHVGKYLLSQPLEWCVCVCVCVGGGGGQLKDAGVQSLWNTPNTTMNTFETHTLTHTTAPFKNLWGCVFLW